MVFKQLKIGDTFEFVYPDSMRFSGLAKGPWKKISIRGYVRVRDGMRCAVGSINVKVAKVS